MATCARLGWFRGRSSPRPRPVRPALLTSLLTACGVAASVGMAACGGTGAAAASPPAAARAAPAGTVIRVDQVGYPLTGPRRAIVLGRASVTGLPYTVTDARGTVVLRGTTGPPLPAWSPRLRSAAADLAGVTAPGRYTVHLGAAGSPPFTIAAAAVLDRPLVAATLSALGVQRDGADVSPGALGRAPSHLDDAHARLYAAPRYRGGILAGPLRPTGGTVDAAGGWMDAGDTLKYAETASFTELTLLRALRDDRAGLGAAEGGVRAEARFGLDWLLRLWDPARRRLVYQIGLGDGNDTTILGAHDVWRRPEHDGTLRAGRHGRERYIRYRPAFATTGPVSPNLAGRLAAAYATAAVVLRPTDPAVATRALTAARSIYAAARTTRVGTLVTAVPHDYYPEVEWRDDMELGATALARATTGAASSAYLRAAARWATAYALSAHNGTDSLNLYDVAAFAHADLAAELRAAGITRLDGVSAATLANDLSGQLRLAAAASQTDPFGYLGAYRDGDVVAHALGWSLETRIIDGLRGTSRLTAAGGRQRDLVLGENAWGMTFVVGAGTSFPRCLHDPVANLSGSLDGNPPLLTGAVVPGPDLASVLRREGQPSGARPCSATAALAPFDGHGVRFEDQVSASANVEPSIDLEGLALLTFATDAGSGT